MRIAWDLDGTLVHTREANVRAYRMVGVEPPPDFHVRPWQEWCSEFEHRRKGVHIAEALRRHATATPLFHIWKQVGGPILTNASEPVIRALRQMWPELARAEIHGQLRSEEKVAWLRAQSQAGLYLDDCQRTVDAVSRRTPWRAAAVSF